MSFRLPRLLLTGIVATALTGATVAGCSGGSSVTQDVGGSLGLQGGNGNIIVLGSHHYMVGDVSGTTLDGSHLDLTSYRGKIVIVNFWGAWCAPCRDEAQGFAQVAKDDAVKGVAFVGIDIRDSKAAAIAFDEQHHVTYPSIFDANEALALQFPHAVPASTPTTIVIGRDGTILAKVTGPLVYTDLRTLVQDALDGKLA